MHRHRRWWKKTEKQAGSLCKDLGNENLAFVLLNRYVDLTEAIDEGNASLLDNSDFAEATNVPLVDDRTLPTKQVGTATHKLVSKQT